MRRDDALRALVWAAGAAGVVAPLVVLSVSAVRGDARPMETFGGAAFAVAFFGITSLVVACTPPTGRLRTSVMASYIAKSVVIVAALWVLSFDSVDRTALAVAVLVSSLAFAVVQTVSVVVRARRAEQAAHDLS